MSEIHIRIEGRAGRITLDRPDALNAVTYKMVLAIEAALDGWRDDPAVDLVLIDGVGKKAFSAGGDLAEMHRSGAAGDYSYGHRFWRDEYRLNAKIAEYPKPYVAFMQGFTMGGGVGVSCHGSHRIVCETSKIAMPECAVGLVPDVGGTHLLARAPGRLGEYLGMTGQRMGPGDAIYAGFADMFVPQTEWEALKQRLVASGNVNEIAGHSVPDAPLQEMKSRIDHAFDGETHRDILNVLNGLDGEWAEKTRAQLGAGSPLSVACTVELVHRARGRDVRAALEQEYRFSHRCMAQGDFVEGIRALIIDKDRSPKWRHDTLADVSSMDVTKMLMPLGAEALDLG